MLFSNAHLTPVLATSLFIVAVIAGYQYRANWKREGPAWKAWLFGSVAGICFLAVGLVPVE